MEIGEELWRQVELSLQRLLSKLAMEIMFNGVFRGAAAPQQADVRCPVAMLVSSVCTPPVPERAERSGADPRWGELFQ